MTIFSLCEVKQPRSLLIHWTGAFGGVGTITRTGNVMFFMYFTQYANQLCKVYMGILSPLVTISGDVLTYRFFVGVVRDLGWWFHEKKGSNSPILYRFELPLPSTSQNLSTYCCYFRSVFGTLSLIFRGHSAPTQPCSCMATLYAYMGQVWTK